MFVVPLQLFLNVRHYQHLILLERKFSRGHVEYCSLELLPVFKKSIWSLINLFLLGVGRAGKPFVLQKKSMT